MIEERRKRAAEVTPERRLDDVKAAATAALDRFNKITAEVTEALRDFATKGRAA